MMVFEPPCTERYARWCERSTAQIMSSLLLDHTINSGQAFNLPRSGHDNNNHESYKTASSNLAFNEKAATENRRNIAAKTLQNRKR